MIWWNSLDISLLVLSQSWRISGYKWYICYETYHLHCSCFSRKSEDVRISCIIYCASPSSGEAYRDQQLTTNFELWFEIFCVPTRFHVRIPKTLSARLSVRTSRKEITIASSVSVLHWYLIHQWKGLHEYYSMKAQISLFLFFF